MKLKRGLGHLKSECFRMCDADKTSGLFLRHPGGLAGSDLLAAETEQDKERVYA